MTNVAGVALRERVGRLFDELEAGLIERTEVLRLVVLAALAGEHVLLVGPPGTAKSEVARRLVTAFEGARRFERLLTRFSVPEELFGPLSIRGLEEDRYERLVAGYLPDAHVAFLDEIFKANSAILNALLCILEERRFDNGARRVPVPLLCAIGASNELPEGGDLAALHDRFLVRLRVEPVSAEGFDALVSLPRDREVHLSATFSVVELEQLRDDAERVDLPGAVRGTLGLVRERLRDRGIVVSDRRFRKMVSLLRMAAHLDGRTRVRLGDLALVAHCAWDRPDQIGAVREALEASLGALFDAEPTRLETVVAALDDASRKDAERKQQATDELGRLLFEDDLGRPTSEPFIVKARANHRGDPLYVPPPGMSPGGTMLREEHTYDELWRRWFEQKPHGIAALERYTSDPLSRSVDRAPRRPIMIEARFTAEHVEGRVRQIDRVVDDLRALLEAVDAELGGPAVPSLFGEGIATSALAQKLAAAKTVLDRMGSRLTDARARTEALPRVAAR